MTFPIATALTCRRTTIAVAAAGALAAAAAGAPAAQADCGYQAVITPFVDHIDSAHLQRSPVQQVKDLMDVDNYVLIHTELVEAMLAPVMPTAEGVVDPFIEHIDTAHLQRSPVQQVKDLMNVDDYVLIHTVLVENMLNPAVEGCGDDGSPPMPMDMHGMPAPAPAPAAAATAPGPQALTIANYAYSPKTVTVPTGTTVTWTNMDGDSHTVTSDSVGGPLKSSSFGMGATYSYTFTKAGTYAYHCSVHPNMKASITVA